MAEIHICAEVNRFCCRCSESSGSKSPHFVSPGSSWWPWRWNPERKNVFFLTWCWMWMIFTHRINCEKPECAYIWSPLCSDWVTGGRGRRLWIPPALIPWIASSGRKLWRSPEESQFAWLWKPLQWREGGAAPLDWMVRSFLIYYRQERMSRSSLQRLQK